MRGLAHDSATSLQGLVKSDQDPLRGRICCLHQKQLINIAISPEKEGTSGTSLLTLWPPISLLWTRSVQVGLFNISRSRCIGLSRLVPRVTDR
jgi:hypothetical protein